MSHDILVSVIFCFEISASDEISHQAVSFSALASTIPGEDEFPYSICVESLITESNGSSLMASVCGGCLALMDAGIPIKSPIAAIAMGMLLNETSSISDANAVMTSPRGRSIHEATRNLSLSECKTMP